MNASRANTYQMFQSPSRDSVWLSTDQLSEQSAGAANYRRGIVSAAKALWLGAMDYYQAFDALDTAIRQGIPRAWYEGAKICGIAPNELSPEERTAMQSALFNQTSYINGFLMFVEDNSKASGGKWSTVAARTNTCEPGKGFSLR